MLELEMNLNVFVIFGLMVLSGMAGYWLRTSKNASFKKKLDNLEKEMLSSHAEILQLQREKIELLQNIQTPSSPVIPIKTTAKEDKTADSFADVSLRKKLLAGQQPVASNK